MSSDAYTESQRPFERINEVRSVKGDVREMKDNLEELQGQLRMLEWQLLEGRGMYDPEVCRRLCEGTASGMEYIAEAIEELPDHYEEGNDDE